MNNSRPGRVDGNLIKGLIAGVVIVACVAWVLFNVTGRKQPELKPVGDTAVIEWMKALPAKQQELYQEMEKVSVVPSEDGKGVTVSGQIRNAADMARIKAALESIQPSVPLTWDLRTGG